MRILITGAAGLVGGRLCRRMCAEGHEILAVSRAERTPVTGERWVRAELTDPRAAVELMERGRPEVVVHCAAEGDADACEREPARAWAVNVEATARLARAAQDGGAHFVYVSTDYVFDGEAGPYSEDGVPNPRSVYGITKHAGEQAARVHAPGCAIARTAVVYGWPPAARRNFGSWLVESLARGERVRLFEDQLVTPSLAASVAAMLSEVAVERRGGVWHLSGGEAVDRVQFGEALCEAFGFDRRLIERSRLASAGLAATRPARAGLRAERACRELKEKPLGLRESLGRFREEWLQAK